MSRLGPVLMVQCANYAQQGLHCGNASRNAALCRIEEKSAIVDVVFSSIATSKGSLLRSKQSRL
jgi:hypothetical protein